MWVVTVLISILLSLFSTAVMSYVSMALPIGPWIAPTLVLLAMILFNVLRQTELYTQNVALVTAAGSVGGIIATALAFSFPSLYFLDPTLFNTWMADPVYFSCVLGSFVLVAAWFGMWVANVLEHKLVVEEGLSFPIGELIHKTIAVQKQVKKSFELVVGFLGTTVFCVLQDGLYAFKGFIPKTVTLIAPTSFSVFTIPLVRFDVWPMLWAIGFVTGHVIALPLAVGALARVVVANPINTVFFPAITSMEFLLAFCSGLVVSGAIQGMIKMPRVLWKSMQKIMQGGVNGAPMINGAGIEKKSFIEFACIVLASTVLFSFLGFSLAVQAYLLFFSFLCTYELAVLAGKIGLAPLGRFATFVMVPAILLFSVDTVQIVFIAVFVQICGGVAADVLFGRKLAMLANIPRQTMQRYQYLGLVVSALSIGVIFWLLIQNFQLGSTELFALKARNRALLIDVRNFDYYVLVLGLLFGLLLKKIKINPSLVLGGLLMPIHISLGLIVGGVAALLTDKKENYYPFWSGVYAANSLWMLIKAML